MQSENNEKILSIESLTYETERQDSNVNVWTTVCVNNLSQKVRRAELTIVLERGSARETIELVEMIEPGETEMESVIRIIEPERWDVETEIPLGEYTLMVGLKCEDEVQAVKEDKVRI